jgi:hypothetical protein
MTIQLVRPEAYMLHARSAERAHLREQAYVDIQVARCLKRLVPPTLPSSVIQHRMQALPLTVHQSSLRPSATVPGDAAQSASWQSAFFRTSSSQVTARDLQKTSEREHDSRSLLGTGCMCRLGRPAAASLHETKRSTSCGTLKLQRY